MTEPIKIDVWSDVVCPWCYIGKRNLEAGLARFEDSGAPVSVEIEYHSFELSPDTPVDFEGSIRDFLMEHRRVSAATAGEMTERVVTIAGDVGLEFDYDAIQHTNTVKAHQLLHLAKSKGLQPELKERLLKAYFVEGRHIGHDEELADLAAEVGIDRDDSLAALESGVYLPAVRADQDQARQLGINGVPFFVLNMKYGLSGAQPPEVFVQALTQAAAD